MKKILKHVIEKKVEWLYLPLGKNLTTLFQGGLGNGDFGICFGNPGGGKSWLLVALGGHAVPVR